MTAENGGLGWRVNAGGVVGDDGKQSGRNRQCRGVYGDGVVGQHVVGIDELRGDRIDADVGCGRGKGDIVRINTSPLTRPLNRADEYRVQVPVEAREAVGQERSAARE